MSVLDPGPRTARTEARGETTLIFIASQFIYILAEHDARAGYLLMRNVGRLIARRLRETDYAIKNRAFLG
jgi:hypothetical protein